MNGKIITAVMVLMIMSGLVIAQDSGNTEVVDTTDYETSPIYGNSSSRGVSTFNVPGQISIGSNSVSRFATYSTDINDLPPIQPVQSRNPLEYTARLPLATYNAIPEMPHQVVTRLNSRMMAGKVTSLESFFDNQKGISMNDNMSEAGRNRKTRSIMDQLTARDDFYSLRFLAAVADNPVLKSMKTSNVSEMFNRKKVLLLSNRAGRMGYSRTDMSRSLLNRAGRINRGKLSSEYNTSAILSR